MALNPIQCLLEGEVLLYGSVRLFRGRQALRMVFFTIVAMAFMDAAMAASYARYKHASSRDVPALSQQLWPRIGQQLSLSLIHI